MWFKSLQAGPNNLKIGQYLATAYFFGHPVLLSWHASKMYTTFDFWTLGVTRDLDISPKTNVLCMPMSTTCYTHCSVIALCTTQYLTWQVLFSCWIGQPQARSPVKYTTVPVVPRVYRHTQIVLFEWSFCQHTYMYLSYFTHVLVPLLPMHTQHVFLSYTLL